MKIKRREFGMLETGESVELYALKAGELQACFSTYGATLVSLIVPSSSGRKDDVVLGFSTLSGYTSKHPYFGATVGRYANRIASGRFVLDGVAYDLDRNDGTASLHGGFRGFDKRVWDAEPFEDKGAVGVLFTLKSPDGDEGYPGNLEAAVAYSLSKDAVLSVRYSATLDRRCPVNLTNHSYFNLKGEGRGDILDHQVRLSSASYLPVDSALIPAGSPVPVAGTPFDFREFKTIGRDLPASGAGYDHCFAVDGKVGAMRPCAEVKEPRMGRTLKVETTQPGVQFYTGNFLDGVMGKRGSSYGKHGGFCLETQHFPDGPNQPSFPPCIFGPGRPYAEASRFIFGW